MSLGSPSTGPVFWMESDDGSNRFAPFSIQSSSLCNWLNQQEREEEEERRSWPTCSRSCSMSGRIVAAPWLEKRHDYWQLIDFPAAEGRKRCGGRRRARSRSRSLIQSRSTRAASRAKRNVCLSQHGQLYRVARLEMKPILISFLLSFFVNHPDRTHSSANMRQAIM